MTTHHSCKRRTRKKKIKKNKKKTRELFYSRRGTPQKRAKRRASKWNEVFLHQDITRFHIFLSERKRRNLVMTVTKNPLHLCSSSSTRKCQTTEIPKTSMHTTKKRDRQKRKKKSRKKGEKTSLRVHHNKSEQRRNEQMKREIFGATTQRGFASSCHWERDETSR